MGPLCLPKILISEYVLVSEHEPTNRKARDSNSGPPQPDGHARSAHQSPMVWPTEPPGQTNSDVPANLYSTFQQLSAAGLPSSSCSDSSTSPQSQATSPMFLGMLQLYTWKKRASLHSVSISEVTTIGCYRNMTITITIIYNVSKNWPMCIICMSVQQQNQTIIRISLS